MEIFLETDRLYLRRLTVEDADNLSELDSDPEVMRYINGGKPTEYEAIRDLFLPRMLRYYERYEGYGFWAAIEKATGEFLGWYHFRPAPDNPDHVELGYRLRRAAWGKGYATEGSRALVRKGFTELGTQRVTAHTLAENAGSRRVLEKAGLELARKFRYEAPNEWHDGREAVEYALSQSEWTPL